jgi:hypothetical protein
MSLNIHQPNIVFQQSGNTTQKKINFNTIQYNMLINFA